MIVQKFSIGPEKKAAILTSWIMLDPGNGSFYELNGHRFVAGRPFVLWKGLWIFRLGDGPETIFLHTWRWRMIKKEWGEMKNRPVVDELL